MKPLAIALSGEQRDWGREEEDGEGNLTNVQCKANQNCDNEFSPLFLIYPNKNWGEKT
jgi:hypothetical protein